MLRGTPPGRPRRWGTVAAGTYVAPFLSPERNWAHDVVPLRPWREGHSPHELWLAIRVAWTLRR